jgi:cell division protein FtsW
MSRTPAQHTGIDPALVLSVLSLIGLGAVMVGSASVFKAMDSFGDPRYYLEQHLIALALGTAGLVVALKTPIEWWNRGATLLLAGALFVLVLVLLPGAAERINGAKRWVDVGPVSFQASELARVMLLIYLVSYAVRQHAALSSSLAGFARPMMLIVLASVLLLLEPDFGATVLLTATSLGVLFLAGARLRDLVVSGIIAGGAFAALIFTQPYRVDRLLSSWLKPWEDAFDGGYQLVNSFIAIGSGTLFGAGLGEGVQKLNYLPEAHTDFIFAVLAEELGLVGATLVIVLFAVIVYRAFEIGRRAVDRELPFHGLLAMGIGLMLGMQAAVSIGVNTGLLPTKGLTLPLLSYGRTSAVTTLFVLGLLFRLASEVDAAERAKPARRNP